MNHRYWLHRISHKMEIAYPLLEKGYLSIGFSAFLKNRSFLEKMIGDNDNKWELFEEENRRIWGDTLYRTRHNLWRFLCEFSQGDYVIVPSWKTFSVYVIKGTPCFAGDVIEDGLTDWNGKKVTPGGEDNRYLLNEEGQIVDIGFVIKVEKVEVDISRSDYAENSLLSRMKIRQTNADISDLKDQVEKAISRHKEEKPISIYSETIKSLSVTLKKVIDDIVDHDQFERLIKCYFETIGADHVSIPSKKDGEGSADGDIVATFDALKLIIYVQAKHHFGKTGDWAVTQISEYTDQKQKEEADSDYNSVAWVISSADDFTREAQERAVEENVRLINGEEFRKMLIDAGMAKLALEFE